MKRVTVCVAAGALLLTGIVVIRTLTAFPAPRSTVPLTAVNVDQNSAIERLSGALRFPTVSASSDLTPDDAAFGGLLDYLERSFPRVDNALAHERVNQYSVLYSWRGSDPSLPGILLLAHLDVVPVEAGTEGLWTYPPFSGERADGFVWGRGAIDMKSSAVALLEAVDGMLAQGMQPKRSVYLAFGHDEEVGGRNGAARIAALLRERGIRIAYSLDEGSYVVDGVVPGVRRPVALVGLAEKGDLSLRLTARAPGGHSSMPSHDEAIVRLSRAVAALEDHQLAPSVGGAVGPMLDALAPEMPFAQRAVFANRWLFEPLLLNVLERTPSTNALIRTTMAATIVQGGIKDNVLPREGSAVINFRIRPGDTIQGVLDHVRETVAGMNIEVEKVGESNEPLPVSSRGTDAFRALRGAVGSVYPDAVFAPALVIAGTDTGHYADIAANSYRLEPVRLAAADLDRIHGVNERIAVKDYLDMIRFYGVFIAEVSKS